MEISCWLDRFNNGDEAFYLLFVFYDRSDETCFSMDGTTVVVVEK